MLSQTIFPVALPIAVGSMHSTREEADAYRAWDNAKGLAKREADRARRAYLDTLKADGYAVSHWSLTSANVSRDGVGGTISIEFDYANNRWEIVITGDELAAILSPAPVSATQEVSMTTTPFNVYHTATGTYLAQFGHDGTHYTVQAADFAHPLHTFDTLEDATAFALEARGFDATDRVTDENPELLYSQTVDGVTVEVYADMSALVGGARVAVSQSQWTRPDVDAVARELIATATAPATQEVPVSTNTQTPLQQTVQLFAETDHIHDLLDAGNVADAFDALVTILHAARAIDPEHETGRDLESQLDWCERQMQAGHDMTKAIRNSISNVEDFAFDMEDMRRTRSREVPVSTETHPYSHDCACDACSALLLNAQTCPHCSCFFVHHDHDVDACGGADAIRELQFELDEVKDAIRESRGYEDDAFMQRLYADRRSLERRIAGLQAGTPQPVRQTAAIRMARERQAAMLDLDAEYGIPTPDFGRYS